MTILATALTLMLGLATAAAAGSVGFQRVTVPDFAAWPHHDRLDRTRIGIYGFSVGGFTALVTIGGTPDLGRIPSYCAEHQDRVCSVLKDRLWRAGNDEVTPHPRHAEAIFNALPTRPDYVVVPNAGHFAFVACSATMAERAPAVCRDAPDFDRDAFHRTFNAAVVSFFEKRLPAP